MSVVRWKGNHDRRSRGGVVQGLAMMVALKQRGGCLAFCSQRVFM